ncbi:MAG: hypothetical protein OXB84_08605, partial [Halobacteriovoraceae bacterium]|nr:hypothetical protein [Halobacteriovoraceae bacterium]
SEWEKKQWRKMGIMEKDFEMAAQKHRKFELLLAEELGKGVDCRNYGSGCVGARKAKVGLTTFIIVEYRNEGLARLAARQLDQYYKYNWLFDEVTDEPVAIYFVQEAFGAVRAKEESTTPP